MSLIVYKTRQDSVFIKVTFIGVRKTANTHSTFVFFLN